MTLSRITRTTCCIANITWVASFSATAVHKQWIFAPYWVWVGSLH